MTISLRPRKGHGQPSDDGRMSLADHLRELRWRLFIAICAIAVGFFVGWIFYDQIIDLLMRPFEQVIAQAAPDRQDEIHPVINNVAGPFVLQAKVSVVTGLVLACPVWLYQIWGFIMPGLYRNEKKWTVIFVSVAGPLFAAGVVLGYWAMPKGLSVLLGFTPDQITNLIDMNHYFMFMLRVLLVFGVAFEIPLFVIMLNLAGIVKGRHLKKFRPWIILGAFAFAAVATPSTDPVTMLLLGAPMTALFLISEGIAHLVDRHRGGEGSVDYSDFDDDEASPLT